MGLATDSDDGDALSDDSLDGDAPIEDDSLLRAIAAAPTPRPRLWLPPGTLIDGAYRIESRLGAGAMGTVYVATDLALDRRVAIKLHGNVHDDAQTSRMWREAKAMARLQDPHVVAVHEVGVHEGRVYIAMELVEGSSVKQWLATPHGWREILDVFTQAARGLAAAHRVGLVHRDFKPANLLIEHSAGGVGRVRVADFGLARAAGEGEPSTGGSSGVARAAGSPSLDERMTQTGVVVGTPAYMAPEQHQGLVDHRSDQYAFFVTMYEALYGVRPFEGGSPAQVVAAAQAGEIAPAPADRPVPPWLRQVVLRGLRVAPEQRHVDMDAVVRALQSDPTRRRRTQIAVAGGLGVVAGLLGVIVHLAGRTSGAPDCDAQAAAIESSWNDDARTRVRDAMLATDVAFAPQAWARVESGLDIWADEWSSATAAACEGDAALDVSLHRARGACLEHGRRAFTALVEVLGAANATTVERAIAAVGGLPDLEACADPDRLAAVMEPPGDPELVRAIEDVRVELSRAEALELAGAFGDGTAVAESAVAGARSVGWAPLLGRALLVRGRLEDAAGAYARAETTLRESYAEALSSATDDVAADAASLLARTVGSHLARHSEGLEWAYHAASLTRRVGSDVRREATLLENRAAILQLRSEYDLALQELSRALAMREEAGGLDPLQLSTTLGELGELHRLRGEYTLAAAQLTRASEIRERALGPQHPAVASTLAALATVDLEVGDRESAAAHARRALSIREQALGPDHPDVAAIMANLGVIVGELGSRQESLALLRRALAIQRRALGSRHPSVASTVEMIGNALLFAEELADAETHYREALEIREQALGQNHHYVARTLNNLGLVNRALGRFDEAVGYLRRALAIDEQRLGPNHPDLSDTLNNLAIVEGDLGHLEAALELQRRALAVRAGQFGADHVGHVGAYMNIGNFLMKLQRWDEACDELRHALAIAEQAGPGRAHEAALARLYLGRAELGRGRPDAAVEQLERALVLRESLETSTPHVADVHFALAIALDEVGRERDRARALAIAAEAVYAALPAEHELRDEVRTWLSAQRR